MTNECWEWPGHRNRYGYGVLQAYGRGGKHMFAHRLIWEQYAGPIPEGMQVLHQCDNPPCIRPTHLFLGTLKDNAMDAAQKGHMGTGKHATHCKRGHPFAGNTYIHPVTGRRSCHECIRLRNSWRRSEEPGRREALERLGKAVSA